VEAVIAKAKEQIADPELAWLFENCYPNTLDTTVRLGSIEGRADTFVITGDIEAMWLRDSSCQVWPYLSLAKGDDALQKLFRGLIARQCRCILLDPYANAFLPDAKSQPLSWAVHDITKMLPGVAERKWEIDSLCYCIRLAHGYWRATGDREPFDREWARAMKLVVATLREQQRKHDRGPYHFQRSSETPTDTLPLEGYGNPARPVGMIYSMFRPSDDACIYPLFVPANLFAVVSLRQLADMASGISSDASFAQECTALADEVERALSQYGRVHDPEHGETWAYEVDGYGNQLSMDDANLPGLLGLPYLECCAKDDPLYRQTRARILSSSNPYFFKGSAAEGIGGPHVGVDMIWPMSIIMRALTSSDDEEIRQCLHFCKTTHAGTGFMHEAFNKDDPKKFTRSWFAWANSLFGELVLKLSKERPWILSDTEPRARA
jgi:meiotically up-regulated gene 157 (Mug157) protein